MSKQSFFEFLMNPSAEVKQQEEVSNKKQSLENKQVICELKNPSQKQINIMEQVLNFNDILEIRHGNGQTVDRYQITKDEETYEKQLKSINDTQFENISETVDEFYKPIFHSYFEG